ncbi:MAG: flagellar motor protein MotB [Burkholderiaceae bacterium]
MSGGDKKLQPIIVKKIKKGGHGHHGGAWKIAYADFVTAMMAFFLLMWLLGSTTKGDLRGISDFFNTPLKVALAGGSGSGDSSSIIKGGGEDLTRSVGQIKRGDIDPKERTRNPHALAREAKRLEGERLKGMQEKLQTMISNDPKLSRLEGQIRMQLTVEGLRIQIVDDQQRAMFPSGKADVEPHMRELLQAIGGLLNEVRNPISISGHTDALPFAAGARGYSNWELSTDRANASRRELVAGGLAPEKIMRVVGMGPAMPLLPADPRNAVNRRIAIVVLTEAAASQMVREPAAFDLGQAALEEATARARSRNAAGAAPGPVDAPAHTTGNIADDQPVEPGAGPGDAASGDGGHDAGSVHETSAHGGSSVGDEHSNAPDSHTPLPAPARSDASHEPPPSTHADAGGARH